ncbi:glycosyltransferase family 4 protein [Bacillus horti]|uniref:Glycosyltransferase involved in cell wall biosynthesis n=1 Tax=Caldalkalibacillus horti TaxID=77523 RepID=A0ABT9VZG2_9BACI|nr:glycosyltransferase family 4 protein [Bacillus horti]MDQ0166376.1 glycosyltransferase involved in cell wall biosynthesis [Bacillus horti]
MERKRYLAIGPLPPPIGGDTVSFSRLLQSQLLNEQVELDVLDTSRKDRESQIGRRLQLKDLMNGFRFFKQAFSYRKKVDGVLIWSNSRFSYTIGLILIALFKLYRKKVILKLFGTSLPALFKRLPYIYQRFAAIFFKKVDYVLPQTTSVVNFFKEEVGLRAEQVVPFPNFLVQEPMELKPLSVERMKKLKAIFVGQVKEPKGVFDILAALEGNEQLSCDFYGTIFEKDRAAFMEQVEKLENATYKGEISSEQVVQTIREYDILLLPSFYPGEGYPGVVIEAFFAGVPVLATYWNDLSDIVINHYNGVLVPIQSPEKIRSKLAKFVEQPTRLRLLEEGATEAAHKYTEKEILGKLLALL